MSFASRVREVALPLIDLLERERIPYLLMGGFALTVWAIPRATYDVDLTLSVDERGLARFLSAVKDAGFHVVPPFERGFKDVLAGMEKIRIQWWTDLARQVDVDVFLVTTAYQEAAFGRRRRVRIEDREAWTLDPADLLLHKLVAWRPKDRADVQNLLAVQGLPDPLYVQEWAGRLGVTAALHEAVAAAGLTPP